MSAGLKLLSGYNSDSDEEVSDNIEHERLPLPSSLKVVVTEEINDDPSLHDGRQRSFPHKRGNWSSLIYIPCNKSEYFDYLFDQILEICSPDVQLIKVKDPHISLTKTFVLYYHWIKQFYTSVKEKMKVLSSYELTFDGLKVYCNEELSRTFVAFTVGRGTNEVAASIQLLDKCLEEYRLPCFYEEGSFHMSIAWCLGNEKAVIERKISESEDLKNIFVDNPDFSMSVGGCVFKTGFKEFKINLSDCKSS